MNAKDKIIVYFLDNHKVVFDRDKVAFKDGDDFFTLSEDYTPEETFDALCRDGKAVVNWKTVCYVREHVEQDPYEDD